MLGLTSRLVSGQDCNGKSRSTTCQSGLSTGSPGVSSFVTPARELEFSYFRCSQKWKVLPKWHKLLLEALLVRRRTVKVLSTARLKPDRVVAQHPRHGQNTSAPQPVQYDLRV